MNHHYFNKALSGVQSGLVFLGVGSFLVFSSSSWAKLPDHSPLPEDYQNQSATAKRDLLWQKIVQYPYTAFPTEGDGKSSAESLCPLRYDFSVYHGVFSAPWLAPRFTHNSDEAPPEADGQPHLKAIHTYGSSALVRWVPFHSIQHSYTGIFQSGGLGILRASLAKPYSEGDYRPGLALKVLVDGKPSVNFHAMVSLDGQKGNKNFFAHAFKNIVDRPQGLDLKLLEIPFNLAIQFYMDHGPQNARTLPLDEASHVTSDGRGVEQAVTPYEIIFAPTESVKNLIPSDDSETDLRRQLAKMQWNRNEPIYTLLVKDQDGTQTLIGELYLESDFISSEYQDKILFFKHQRKINPG